MDVLSKMMICFVVAATCIQQLAEGYPSSDIDTCIVPTDIVIPSTNPRCKILKDVRPSLVIYENRATEFCVVTTTECEEGLLYWNGDPYYHSRPANRTVEGDVAVFRYSLRSEEVTKAENGSRVQFVLSPGVNGSVRSRASVILVAGPPIQPKNITVNFSCTGANISWSPSPTAQCYVATVECGDSFVLNTTVFNSNYQFSYSTADERLCRISVQAVNPAGSSDVNSISRRFAKEANYTLYDLGVKFNGDGKAYVFFNVTVKNKCSSFSGPYYFILCVDGGMCVNVTAGSVGDNWLYKDVTQRLLPPHKHFMATIDVCDALKCTMLSKRFATFHLKSFGRCRDNGKCLFHCEFVQGFRGKGCVYTITDQETNRIIKTEFIKIGESLRYDIGYDGLFSIAVYDWENGFEWNAISPAFTDSVQVSTQVHIKDDKINIELIAGLSSAGGIFLLLIAAAAIIIAIVVWLRKRQTVRQDFNSGTNRRPGLGSDDTDGDPNATALTLFSHPDDKKPDDETKFDSLTESSEGNSTINLKETTPLEQSTPPLVPGHVLVTDGGGGRGVSETPIQGGVSETNTTSVYGSEEPLMNKRSPSRPPAKHLEGSGGGRQRIEMISQDFQSSKFANMDLEQVGVSMTTGEAIVAVNNGGSSSGIVCGTKVFPVENKKAFSLATSSEAQSSDVNSQLQVVP